MTTSFDPRDYSPERLRAELEQLSRWQVAVFTAACVEVLAPSYVRFAELEEVGDPDLVTGTVEAVWAGLAGPPAELDDLELPSSETIRLLMPQEEDWNEWAPQAENAVAALSFLVDVVRTGQPELAVRAANQAHEAVDEFAARDLDDDVEDFLESTLVEDELERQLNLITAMRQAPDEGRSMMMQVQAEARARAIGGYS